MKKLLIPLLAAMLMLMCTMPAASLMIKDAYPPVSAAAEYVEVIPCRYDTAQYFREGLAVVSNNGKYGVIDKTGWEIVALKYDYINDFSGGLAAFIFEGKYGVIDTAGDVIVQRNLYDYIDNFSAGCAIVQRNYKYGLIGKEGQEIVAPKYDFLYSLSEGLAIFELEQKYGVVDTAGKEVAAAKYDHIAYFCEGLAIVELNGKYGFIDSTGKEILVPGSCNYMYISDFSGGLASVASGDNEASQLGLIDKTGREIVAPKYSSIGSFYEGLAVVYLGEWPNGKCGVIDKTGTEIIPPDSRYYSIRQFSEGLAAVFVGDPETGAWGFIDRTGKEVAAPKYNKVGSFSCGLAQVMINYNFGFIDIAGKEVIPLKYGQTNSFHDDLAEVRLGDWQTGKWGAIDTTGKEIIAPKYEEELYFSNGLARAKFGGKYGIIDITGQEVVPHRYEDMQDLLYSSDDMLAVQKDGKWGYISIANATADNPSAWAAAEVAEAIAAGLVPQSLKTNYTWPITRIEFCTLAAALYEAAGGAKITEFLSFLDTEDENVRKMAAAGVVFGIGNGLFDPDARLTREQAAAMLARLAASLEKPLPVQAAAFNDKGAISSWALESVGRVQAAGIMNGVGNNTFAPQDSYTREQSILTMLRLWYAMQNE